MIWHPSPILVIAVLVLCFAAFTSNFSRVIELIAKGKPRVRWNELEKRVFSVIENVFLHKKLMRDPVAGIIHFIIFYGFVILTAGTLEWMYFGVSGGQKFSFLGGAYPLFALSQDLFNVLVLGAVIAAFYRRIVVKPKRMADNSKKSKWDAYFILSLIAGLTITNLLHHSFEISLGEDAYSGFEPAAKFLSSLWNADLPRESLAAFFWWGHLLIVLGFLNFLPFSKHLHVIVALPNTFFLKTEPRGQLSKLNLEDESITKFGAEKLQELSWKNLFDSFSCTECGRCNEFCPTATTGKELRPKSLMIQMRAATSAKKFEEDLVPAVFTDQFVWDCTTCGACVEACPVMIDHVDAIVDMRRALVLNKGSNPDEATNAFRNWETASNPWGFSESSRQEWLLEKGVPKYEADQDFEFLYYIGCAGSFDDRNKKVVDSVVKVLQKANIKFGILGREEKCNGETARRLGNEYLGQQMIAANKESLDKYKVKKILTSCPHCFNTLKNEYPDFGGNYEVIHHTEYIEELISSGKIQPLADKTKKITYHDSCYIGRYNGVFEEPRDALKAVGGQKPIELKRSKEQGFCCGAGGGRMWLEEKTGTRINQNRAQEIAASGANTVSVACPFCMTMISDGLKSEGREDIQVKDLSELVAESL